MRCSKVILLFVYDIMERSLVCISFVIMKNEVEVFG